MSATALTDYIEDTHHSYTRKALPEIAELLNTIARVHGKTMKNYLRYIACSNVKIRFRAAFNQRRNDLFLTLRMKK